MKDFYCDKCKGTTKDYECCDNPSCPNQPCCGKPLKYCDCNPLTKERLLEMDEGQIFGIGLISNIHIWTGLLNFEEGKSLMWVAKRGAIHDWTIYAGPAENGSVWVMDYGNKIIDRKIVNDLVPHTDSGWKMFRK